MTKNNYYRPKSLNLSKYGLTGIYCFNNWIATNHLALKQDFLKSLKGNHFRTAKSQAEREIIKTVAARLAGDAPLHKHREQAIETFLIDFKNARDNFERLNLTNAYQWVRQGTEALGFIGSREVYCFNESYASVFFAAGVEVFVKSNDSCSVGYVLSEGEVAGLVMPLKHNLKKDSPFLQPLKKLSIKIKTKKSEVKNELK